MPKPYLELPHKAQTADYTCLPACVRMVMACQGIELSEAEVASLLGTDEFGTAAPSVHAVSRHGFLSVLYRGTWADLARHLAVGIPCIALLYTIHLPYCAVNRAGRHAVVVVGFDEQSVWIHDPSLRAGPTEVPRASFEAAWEARGYRLIVLARLAGVPNE